MRLTTLWYCISINAYRTEVSNRRPRLSLLSHPRRQPKRNLNQPTTNEPSRRQRNDGERLSGRRNDCTGRNADSNAVGGTLPMIRAMTASGGMWTGLVQDPPDAAQRTSVTTRQSPRIVSRVARGHRRNVTNRHEHGRVVVIMTQLIERKKENGGTGAGSQVQKGSSRLGCNGGVDETYIF